eukprot:scaffold89052_cov63-Phaeocystis_antarctica.AAC.2
MRRLFPLPPAGTPRPSLPEGPGPLLVIGLVGGEAHGPHAWSNRLTESPAFRVPGSASSPACELCMHHDQHHGVLYLSLSSSMASQALLEQADVLARATSKQAVHAWLVEKSTEHMRALLLLFHLSHAVLVLSDARCVDVGLLRQLRTLHTLKQAVQPTVQVALKPVLHPASRGGGQRNDQRNDQRNEAQLPTLPALGFVFASPPVPSPDAPGADGSLSARIRLEAALEAQVRALLGSSKLLMRCGGGGHSGGGGASQLYSLHRDGCVHVQPHAQPPLSLAGCRDAAEPGYFRMLELLAAPPRPFAPAAPLDAAANHAEPSPSGHAPPPAAPPASAAGQPPGGFPPGGLSALLSDLRGSATLIESLRGREGAPPPPPLHPGAQVAALRAFVCRLLGDGGGAQLTADGALAAHPQAVQQARLPSASLWSSVATQLLDKVFCAEATPAPEEPRGGEPRATALLGAGSGGDGGGRRVLTAAALGRALDAETAFSTARCQAALPAARDLYSRALPPQYSQEVHDARVAAATEFFLTAAFGLASDSHVVRLRRECMSLWKAGRQLCDGRSLTGRQCTYRQHPLPGKPASDGLAAASGLLRVRDQLLSVNDVAVVGHARTTAILKAAVGVLRLRIERPPPAEPSDDEATAPAAAADDDDPDPDPDPAEASSPATAEPAAAEPAADAEEVEEAREGSTEEAPGPTPEVPARVLAPAPPAAEQAAELAAAEPAAALVAATASEGQSEPVTPEWQSELVLPAAVPPPVALPAALPPTAPPVAAPPDVAPSDAAPPVPLTAVPPTASRRRLRPPQCLEVQLFKPLASSRLGIVLTSTTPDTGVPTIAALPSAATASATAAASSAGADARAARPHCSAHDGLHACHCGRVQLKRRDPFELEELEAYFDAPCCDELPHATLQLHHRGGGGGGGGGGVGGGNAARLSLLGTAGGPRGGRSLAGHEGVLPRFGALRVLNVVAWPVPDAPKAKEVAKAAEKAAMHFPSLRREEAKAEEEVETEARPPPLALSDALTGVRGTAAAVAAAAAAAAGGGRTSPPARGVQPRTLELMVGLEYECAEGHRFVARPGSASGRNSPADAPSAPLAIAMAEETPLARSCAAEGCTRSAQLLRLHVRSTEAAQQLLLRPRVRFLAADNGAASAAAAELFEPDVPLLLPSETALCLRLPLIFNAAGKPLLTAATAADASRARKAVLLPHWLCMAGAADLPADA